MIPTANTKPSKSFLRLNVSWNLHRGTRSYAVGQNVGRRFVADKTLTQNFTGNTTQIPWFPSSPLHHSTGTFPVASSQGIMDWLASCMARALPSVKARQWFPLCPPPAGASSPHRPAVGACVAVERITVTSASSHVPLASCTVDLHCRASRNTGTG